MPFYDFRCTVCGHEFDEMQHHSAPNPPCPNHTTYDGDVCCGETVKIPSRPSPPQGGDTKKFYPGR